MFLNDKYGSSILLTSIFLSSVVLTAVVSNYAFAIYFGAADYWGCNSNTKKTLGKLKVTTVQNGYSHWLTIPISLLPRAG
jgi:hypothetical protein